MSSRVLLINLILIVLISGCSNSDNDLFVKSMSSDDNDHLVMEKTGSITLESDQSVKHGRFNVYIAVNKQKNRLALYDHLQNRVVIADSTGKVLSLIGQKGQGPGEFLNVTMYNFDDEDRLVTYDDSQKKITIFNTDGSIFNSFIVDVENVHFPVGRNLYASNETIFFGIIDPAEMNSVWNSPAVAQINYEGNLIRHIGSHDPFLENSTVYWMYPYFYADPKNDRIQIVNESSYRVQIFTIGENKREKYFGRISENYLITDKSTNQSTPRHLLNEISKEMSFSNGVYRFENYIYYYFINLTDTWHETKDLNERIHYINVYDAETNEFIDEIKLPGALISFSNGCFYLLEDDNPVNFRIGIFKINHV